MLLHLIDDPVYIGAYFGVDWACVGGAVERTEARYPKQIPLFIFWLAKTSLAYERTATVALTRVGFDSTCSTSTNHGVRVVETQRQGSYTYLVLLYGYFAFFDSLYLLVVIFIGRAETFTFQNKILD
jgi:hypothetical protein